jgi:hypothetical protein
MAHADKEPRPHTPRKQGPTSDPGHPQPKAAEVESARLLMDQSREQLRAAGLDDEEIRRLADEYIALHIGEGLPEFIAWAKKQHTS